LTVQVLRYQFCSSGTTSYRSTLFRSTPTYIHVRMVTSFAFAVAAVLAHGYVVHYILQLPLFTRSLLLWFAFVTFSTVVATHWVVPSPFTFCARPVPAPRYICPLPIHLRDSPTHTGYGWWSPYICCWLLVAGSLVGLHTLGLGYVYVCICGWVLVWPTFGLPQDFGCYTPHTLFAPFGYFRMVGALRFFPTLPHTVTFSSLPVPQFSSVGLRLVRLLYDITS